MFRAQIAPLLITDILPNASGVTADSPGVAVASDGRQYVLKAVTLAKPLLPATEAFCSDLATACQLPVADTAWLQDDDANEYFGSRHEAGIIKSIADSAIARRTPLFTHSMKRRWMRCDNKQVASGLYALDLFLFNYDRHFYNYLFQDNGTRTEVIAIDYSCAFWTVSPDLTALPAPADMLIMDKRIERTVRVGRIIRKWIGFDQMMAKRTLAMLRLVRTSWVQNFCMQIPPAWMTDSEKASLLAWWDSPARLQRIDAIEQGINNGSLL